MNSGLARLLNHYGSDKDRNGYTPVYEAILKRWRGDVGALLEVGIGTLIPNHPSSMVGYHLPGYKPGGSLRAWRDWLPRASIVGLDVAPDTQFSEERIETFLADSTSIVACDALLGDRYFDVIIDDGLHTHDAQIATMRNLFRRMRSGGYYVVEDIHPDSHFFLSLESLRDVLKGCAWFTTERKNIAVFTL